MQYVGHPVAARARAKTTYVGGEKKQKNSVATGASRLRPAHQSYHRLTLWLMGGLCATRLRPAHRSDQGRIFGDRRVRAG